MRTYLVFFTLVFGLSLAWAQEATPPPAAPAPAPAAAPAAATPSLADGARIWNDKKAKCAQCHGVDGKGDTKMGKTKGVADMTTAEWHKKVTDAQIVDAILKGVDREENGKKVKMEALKGATPNDAQSLLLHIRTFAPKAP